MREVLSHLSLRIDNRNSGLEPLAFETACKMIHDLNHRSLAAPFCWLLLLFCSVCFLSPGFLLTASAQIPGKAPSLSLVPIPPITAQRAKQTMVDLNFRIPAGYHINSNTPKSEFLIATALKMELPTDIVLGKIEYPPGEDASFPFSPDEKLSVYSGDFTIAVAVHPLHSVVPGKYEMRGVLRYQACDNAACYPPKNLPVNFEVKVVKEPAEHHANPAQSPHVHG